MSIEHHDATELSDASGEIDNLDNGLDATEDAATLEEMVEGDQPHGEVTAQDLSAQDLIDDGEDLATDLDDDDRAERRLDGVVPLDEEMVFDDEGHSETLEERFQQEEPDPNSSIVPDDAGRRA